MTRFAPRLLVLLATTALAGCTMLAEPDLKETLAVTEKPQTARNFANDIDGNVRQATLLRLAGKNDEAIQILSQLTLIAADDARVVGEYGKALAQKGRAQDATQFLRRAIDLSPNDWTLYSALGVAYDQTGDQVNARAAYEHALVLRPGEASILNNYALSRMLANDPENARTLIAAAQATGATGDEKIARNVALINDMSASKAAAALPAPLPQLAKAVPQPAKPTPPIEVVETPAVANNAPRALAGEVARQLASQSPVAAPAASNAPRTLVPVDQFQAAPPEVSQAAVVLPQQQAAIVMPPLQERRVVMQAVPFDPLAGPVKPRPTAKPKAVAAKKSAPVQQAQVPSLRITNEQY